MLTPAERAKIKEQIAIRTKAMAARGRPAKRLKLPPKPAWPAAMERRYAAAIMVPIRDIQAAIDKALIPALPHIVEVAARDRPAAARADGDYADIVQGIMGTLVVQFFGTWTDDRLAPIATGFAAELQKYNQAQLAKAFKQVLGAEIFKSEPWLAAEIKAFTTQNVEKMKSLARQHFTRLENVVYDGVRQGWAPQRMAEDLRDAPLRIAKAKAAGIARDQLGTLGGQLTLLRQTAEGITRYRWRGQLDGKERHEHAVREGKIFPWADAPNGGPPGFPKGCRCGAEPVFDDIAGEYLGDF